MLRLQIDPHRPFSELLESVRQTVIEAFKHEVVFEKLVEELKPERDAGRSPYFQTMLTVQHKSDYSITLPNAEVAPLADVNWTTSKFDLTVKGLMKQTFQVLQVVNHLPSLHEYFQYHLVQPQ